MHVIQKLINHCNTLYPGINYFDTFLWEDWEALQKLPDLNYEDDKGLNLATHAFLTPNYLIPILHRLKLLDKLNLEAYNPDIEISFIADTIMHNINEELPWNYTTFKTLAVNLTYLPKDIIARIKVFGDEIFLPIQMWRDRKQPSLDALRKEGHFLKGKQPWDERHLPKKEIQALEKEIQVLEGEIRTLEFILDTLEGHEVGSRYQNEIREVEGFVNKGLAVSLERSLLQRKAPSPIEDQESLKQEVEAARELVKEHMEKLNND